MSQQTILLADDDELIVDVLRHQLEREGFGVIATGNGAEALTLARTQQPGLGNIGVMMPTPQGWEACGELPR